MANDLTVKGEDGKELALNYGEAAGVGMEHAHETGTTPFLELLQPLSKVVTQELIPGARPGMIAVKSARKLYPGNPGVFYIAVAEMRVFVEWTPRDKGGGYVAEFAPTDPVVLEAIKKSGKKINLQTPAGNNLNETFRQIGFIVEEWKDLAAPDRLQPVVVSFERMKIPARAQIMDRLRMHKATIPLFAAKLRMATKLQPSKKGDFFNFAFSFAVGDDLMQSLILPNDPVWPDWSARCIELAKLFRAGEIKIEKPAESDASADAEEAAGKACPF